MKKINSLELIWILFSSNSFCVFVFFLFCSWNSWPVSNPGCRCCGRNRSWFSWKSGNVPGGVRSWRPWWGTSASPTNLSVTWCSLGTWRRWWTSCSACPAASPESRTPWAGWMAAQSLRRRWVTTKGLNLFSSLLSRCSYAQLISLTAYLSP